MSTFPNKNECGSPIVQTSSCLVTLVCFPCRKLKQFSPLWCTFRHCAVHGSVSIIAKKAVALSGPYTTYSSICSELNGGRWRDGANLSSYRGIRNSAPSSSTKWIPGPFSLFLGSDATFVLEAAFSCHCNLSDPLEPRDCSRSEHAESQRYELPLDRSWHEIPTEW